MSTDHSKRPNLDQLSNFAKQALGGGSETKKEPIETVQAPAPKSKGATYTPGDKHDQYKGHGGDFMIDHRGHRVPVKK